jgi:hypothetical protein
MQRNLCENKPTWRPLGGVVVSVLATGPNGRELKPGLGNGFLKAIKFRSTPSFGWELNRRSHVVRFYGTLKTP